MTAQVSDLPVTLALTPVQIAQQHPHNYVGSGPTCTKCNLLKDAAVHRLAAAGYNFTPSINPVVAATPSGADAPYKIEHKDGKWVVVNNAGLSKATFSDRQKALDYQRALYANVPGAAKRADKVPFTGKAKTRVPEAALVKSPIAAQVKDYLAKSYPKNVLGWVDDANWTTTDVPLSQIDMARRPGGRDDDKTKAIAAKMADGASMPPVVLVKGADGKHAVADGYHRTKAAERLGKRTISAHVASGLPENGPWNTAMHAAKFATERSFVTEVGDRVLVTAKLGLVSSVDDVPRDMAARWEQGSKANPHNLYLQGRFVEAENPNRNGAFWTADDLAYGEHSVANGPLNILHDLGAIVGCFTDGRLYKPDGSAREAAGETTRPHIVAQAVLWQSIFPKAASVIRAQAEVGQLYFSMEAVSQSVSCETSADGRRQGCGKNFPWEVAQGDARGACEHLQNRTSQRHMVNPTFVGGALIIPPGRPAWADADIEVIQTEAAALQEGSGMSQEQLECLLAEVRTYGNRLAS